ncbi:MAG TPA: hypothetical protein VL576_02210 [Candidatus Paceibacterota bacterium]|jgi:hypothetical protein|nr:hypothetical protein [Candidatus Paceibacterota bacterium]
MIIKTETPDALALIMELEITRADMDYDFEYLRQRNNRGITEKNVARQKDFTPRWNLCESTVDIHAEYMLKSDLGNFYCRCDLPHISALLKKYESEFLKSEQSVYFLTSYWGWFGGGGFLYPVPEWTELPGWYKFNKNGFSPGCGFDSREEIHKGRRFIFPRPYGT